MCSLVPDEAGCSGLGNVKYPGDCDAELPVDECAGSGHEMVYVVPVLLLAVPVLLLSAPLPVLLRLPRSNGLLRNSSSIVVMFVSTRKTLVMPLTDYLQPRKLMIPLPRNFLVQTMWLTRPLNVFVKVKVNSIAYPTETAWMVSMINVM